MHHRDFHNIIGAVTIHRCMSPSITLSHFGSCCIKIVDSREQYQHKQMVSRLTWGYPPRAPPGKPWHPSKASHQVNNTAPACLCLSHVSLNLYLLLSAMLPHAWQLHSVQVLNCATPMRWCCDDGMSNSTSSNQGGGPQLACSLLCLATFKAPTCSVFLCKARYRYCTLLLLCDTYCGTLRLVCQHTSQTISPCTW